MKSIDSRSPASPDARRGAALRHTWPTVILRPVFLGMLLAAAIAPYMAMFLGPDFGLSGGREAPWPWGIIAIVPLAVWTATAIGRSRIHQNAQSAMLILLGLVVVVCWLALDRNWDVAGLVRRPWSLFGGNEHLAVPVILGLFVWVIGSRWTFDVSAMSGDSAREKVGYTIVALVAAILLASMVGGDMGRAGIHAALVSVPMAIVGGIGAVGVGEMQNTRTSALRRGSTAPGWDRWMRVFAGTAAALLLLTLIAAVVLGPGFLQAMMTGIGTVWDWLVTALVWVLYWIVFGIFWVIEKIAHLLTSLFGESVIPKLEVQNPIEPPEPIVEEQPDEADSDWLRNIVRRTGYVIAFLVALALVFFARRFRAPAETDAPDEERERIFSADLMKKQLRDLFRRREHEERPRRIDFGQDPASVRETMVYLQVLAERQYVPRLDRETPRDFTERLAGAWGGVGEAMAALADVYERVRYGETDADRQQALTAWRTILAARRDVKVEPPAIASGGDGPDTGRIHHANMERKTKSGRAEAMRGHGVYQS